MFRRLPNDLPKDYAVPKSLEEYRYVINDEGIVHSKSDPHKLFDVKSVPRGRYSDMRCGLVISGICDNIHARMQNFNVQKLYLPQMTLEKPEKSQTLPILITNPETLKTKTRILVLIPHMQCNLGLHDTRMSQMFSQSGFLLQSTVPLARHLLDNEPNSPGLVIMNPNELYYSWEQDKGLTHTAWINQTKPSSLHQYHTAHDEWNRTPQNKTADEHVRFVFENVLANYPSIRKDAKIDIIAMLDAAQSVLPYLNKNWDAWSTRVSTISFINCWPNDDAVTEKRFIEFLRARCRQWEDSDEPLNTPIACPSQNHFAKEEGVVVDVCLYPKFSAGNTDEMGPIFSQIMEFILDWQNEASDPAYSNPAFPIPKAENLSWLLQERQEVDTSTNDNLITS